MGQIDYCKIADSNYYHNKYDYHYLYNIFLCMGLHVDVYVSTSITVHYHICYLPCMIL